MGVLGNLDVAGFALGFAMGMLVVYAIAPAPRCYGVTAREGPLLDGTAREGPLLDRTCCVPR